MSTQLEITPLRLGKQDAGRLVTAEEFRTADFEEGFTYERVRGRLVVMPPAGDGERRLSSLFRRKLGGYWGTHEKMVDGVEPHCWLITSPDDLRVPHVSVYLAGESSDQEIPDRVPDLIFEFISGDRSNQERAYIHKRAEYHAIGVKEYVIVDRFKQQALVLTREPQDFAERVLSSTDDYTTPLLPGLSVPLGEVFAEFGKG